MPLLQQLFASTFPHLAESQGAGQPLFVDLGINDESRRREADTSGTGRKKYTDLGSGPPRPPQTAQADDVISLGEDTPQGDVTDTAVVPTTSVDDATNQNLDVMQPALTDLGMIGDAARRGDQATPRGATQDEAWQQMTDARKLAARDEMDQAGPDMSGPPLERQPVPNPGAPPMQDQAVTALAPNGAPGTAGMTIKNGQIVEKPPVPVFTRDPDKSDLENKRDENRFNIEHPQNQDHGVRGLIREALQNLFYGLAHTQPGMDWKQTLALGGAGAGLGIANRSWNERRASEDASPRLDQQVQQEQVSNERQSKIDNTKIDNQRADLEEKRKVEKDKAAVDYWNRKADTADWKAATADDLLKLRDKWATSKDANDKRRLTAVEGELKERNRHNVEMGAQGAIKNANTVKTSNMNRSAQEVLTNIRTAAQARTTLAKIEASDATEPQKAAARKVLQDHLTNLPK